MIFSEATQLCLVPLTKEAGAAGNPDIPGVGLWDGVRACAFPEQLAEDGSKGVPHKQGRQSEVHLHIVADKSP